jgi:cytochrome c oxidase subunit 1
VSAPAVRRVTAPERHDLLAWLTTTDHKRIGILYMGASAFFLLVAGLLAMLIRTQLARPGATILASQPYNEVFTLHGTAMIFLVITPFAFGLANYLIPLQIGAPDMAFPRLNATSFWIFLFGGITVFSGAAINDGGATSGWTSYAPLSEITVSAGTGQDL